MTDKETGKSFIYKELPSVQEAKEAVEAMNQLFIWMSDFLPEEIKRCSNYHDITTLIKSIITTHNNLVILLSGVCGCDNQFKPKITNTTCDTSEKTNNKNINGS